MKISWSFNLTGEFTIFYLFIFSEDLHMCSPYQYRQMCGKIFFIVLQLEDIKKKRKFWFLHASRNQVFRFCIIIAEQNKTKIFFVHNFADIAIITREYMFKIVEKNDNLYLANRQ